MPLVVRPLLSCGSTMADGMIGCVLLIDGDDANGVNDARSFAVGGIRRHCRFGRTERSFSPWRRADAVVTDANSRGALALKSHVVCAMTRAFGVFASC